MRAVVTSRQFLPLDAIQKSPSPDPSPSMQAVSREEEAILWRALERIPDTYREPLILFYREEQSIERVAAELELSEDGQPISLRSQRLDHVNSGCSSRGHRRGNHGGKQ